MFDGLENYLINEDNEENSTSITIASANVFANTAQQINNIYENSGGELFILLFENNPTSADDSFTITAPIRVRILMTPGN